MVEKLSQDRIAEFREAFKIFDQDGGGDIGISELEMIFNSIGQYPSSNELNEIMAEVDLDGRGTIDFDEFLVLMARKMNDPETYEELIEAFKLFDKDSIKLIHADDLKHSMLQYGPRMSENDVEELIKEAMNEDGYIDYEDFVKNILNS